MDRYLKAALLLLQAAEELEEVEDFDKNADECLFKVNDALYEVRRVIGEWESIYG